MLANGVGAEKCATLGLAWKTLQAWCVPCVQSAPAEAEEPGDPRRVPASRAATWKGALC